MNFNGFFSNFEMLDKFNRQMEAIDKWNNVWKVNESIERHINPLGKQWAAIEKIAKINRQMEAIDRWNNISKMNENIGRLIYPFEEKWAEMERLERSQKAWSKSIAALSPIIGATHDYFSTLETIIHPPSLTALQKSLEIENSINKVSTIMTATAAFDKHNSFIEKFTSLNDFASSLTVDVLGETITLDNFQSNLNGLHEKIDELRKELQKERNRKDLIKQFDRWIAIIGIIVGLISIYFSVINPPSNATHIYKQDLIEAQNETLKAFRQFIIPRCPKRVWVTNRKCKIYSRPYSSSIIMDNIPATSTVDIIVLRQKWACVSYYVDDTTIKTGWVDKNYLDTLKGQKRSGNQSLFNR